MIIIMETLGETSEFKKKYGKDTFIPWNSHSVNDGIRQKLVMLLNPERTIYGNDWRMLASHIGYNIVEINYIRSLKRIDTMILFQKYDENATASLNMIYNCLWIMGRKDCLDIIDQAYQGIIKDAVEKKMKLLLSEKYKSFCKDIDKDVLSLCRFLAKNGFTCNVDVKEINGLKYNFEWCLQKISEADFIVICFSSKYLQDTQKNNRFEHLPDCDKSHLHTKEIYDHLNSEKAQKENSSGRIIKSRCIIPLLFDHMQTADLPTWLRAQGCAYRWKKNYKDLIRKGLKKGQTL